MNVITRGVRNAFRNRIRTFSLVIILGLSIGLALAMLVARQAVQDKITSVKSSIGNTISVSPAGAQGFQGGGEPLTTEQLAKVSAVANVTKVTQSLNDRLTTETSNLQSAVEAGSLGNRSAGSSGVGFQQAPPEMPDQARTDSSSNSGQRTFTRTFTPPVMVTGVNDASASSVYGGSTVSFTSGSAFDASKDEDVAVVGKALAEKNNLTVGSTFTAYSKTIKVVGIFDAGSTFANNAVIMPLAAVQRLSDQAGSVTSATVTVNSIDNLDGAVAAIKTALGSSADVTSNQESAKQTIEPLESVRTISTFSLVGAVVAGGVIILLTMVMIVRERRREIGVYKAIGASNIRIMIQFISEAVTLTVLGLIAGLVIGIAAANPITKVLVNNSTSSSTQTTQQASPETRRGPGAGGFRAIGNNTLTNARNVQANVGPEILAYGAATAILIAIIGSAIPTLLISKIRPAEVMRAE